MAITRRQMLKGSTGAGLGLLLAGPLKLVNPAAAEPAEAAKAAGGGFGPLKPDPAGLLDLPAGFSYRVVSRAGLPLAGQPSGTTPGRPDGTASFWGSLGSVLLVQNHEQGTSADHPALAAADFTY